MKRLLLTCVLIAAFAVPGFAQEVVLTGWVHSGAMTPDRGLKVMVEDVVPEFERLHPGIKVNWEFMSSGELREKLLVAAASGVGPDIFIDGNNLIGGRADAGLLVPLDAYLERWEFTNEIVDPRLGQYRGVTYAIPYDTKASPLAYREDHFLESGLDPNAPPGSWDEYIEYARRLTRIEGERVVRMGSQVGDSLNSEARFFNIALQMNGGRMLDAAYERVTFNNPVGDEALTWLRDLRQAAAPVGYALPNRNFRNGNVSMSFRENTLPQTLGTDEAAWAATRVTLPLMKGGDMQERVTWGGGTGISISAFSPHIDAAWTFVAYVMRPENQIALHRAQESFPTLRTALLDEHFRTNDIMAAMAEAAPYLLEFDRSESAPEYDDIRNDIGRELQRVYNGEQSISAALIQAEQIWTAAILRRLAQ